MARTTFAGRPITMLRGGIFVRGATSDPARDDRLVADLAVVEEDGAHPDEAPVADGAAVDEREVADGDVVADGGWRPDRR